MLFFDFLSKVDLNETDHLPLLPMGRTLSSEALKSMSNPKESAVGIHCYLNNENNHEFLLIERSEYNGKHSGQIAFPGGKKEVSDIDLMATARRECHEEIGIKITDGILIRELSPVYIPVSNFRMVPFVFYHQEKPILTLNRREVKDVIPLTLEDLSFALSITLRNIPVDKNSLFIRDVPGFEHGTYWIWGATALVLSQLKSTFIAWKKESR